MKAVTFHEFGGIAQLQYEDVPEPKPGLGEVLVRVRACAVNHLDLWVRRGVPAYRTPLPHIAGSEIAGEIAALGEGVEGWQAGDRVAVYPGLSDWTCEYCLRGDNNVCVNFRLIGARTPGGYAELVAVPARNLVRIPEGISFQQMAAVPLVFLTAWHVLITRARLRPGEDVLILAGGSGVGSAGIEVAKLAGARVFATASTEEKLERARDLGADVLINYAEVDFAEEVARLTGGRGVDVVFEHVGESTFEKSVACLARNGRLVTCGATTGPDGRFDIRRLYSRQLSIIGSMLGTLEELHTVTKLVGDGKLRPVVERVLPLADAAQAQQLVESRQVFGKIVLVP